MRPLPVAQTGLNVAAKMSELPKLAGQSVSGAGRGTPPLPRSEMRQASMAGQSAALRVSFQTAAP